MIEDKINVDIERLEPINYLKWMPKDVEIDDSGIFFLNSLLLKIIKIDCLELPHVIEIYDFPAQFKNEDIITSLKNCM